MANSNFANWMRGTAPYINTHRGRTFVLALGGDAIAHPQFAHFVHDVALMTSLGIRLVIVHGARQQIDAALKDSGDAARYHQHLRVTDEAAMQIVKDTVGGLSIHIEAQLSTGVPGTPMHRARVRVVTGNFVAARPIGVLDGVDLGFTGSTRRVDVAGIRAQLDLGNTVLISPLGYSPSGEVFNLNADDLAATVATSLLAEKLIVLDDEQGVLDHDGELLTELTPSALERLIAQRAPNLPRTVRLAALLRAARGGVARCHVVSYVDDGALLTELFTHEGAGTQVADDSYENIRSATPDDVAGIIDLIAPLEQAGVLVRRSREVLERECDHFVVVELDGLIIGCAALYPFPDSQQGELACLATHAEYRNRTPFESSQGDEALTLGETLLRAIEQRARTQGFKRLFALTTQSSDWFREHGFSNADVASLPAHKQRMYNLQRNSKVLTKEL